MFAYRKLRTIFRVQILDEAVAFNFTQLFVWIHLLYVIHLPIIVGVNSKAGFLDLGGNQIRRRKILNSNQGWRELDSIRVSCLRHITAARAAVNMEVLWSKRITGDITWCDDKTDKHASTARMQRRFNRGILAIMWCGGRHLAGPLRSVLLSTSSFPIQKLCFLLCYRLALCDYNWLKLRLTLNMWCNVKSLYVELVTEHCNHIRWAQFLNFLFNVMKQVNVTFQIMDICRVSTNKKECQMSEVIFNTTNLEFCKRTVMQSFRPLISRFFLRIIYLWYGAHYCKDYLP